MIISNVADDLQSWSDCGRSWRAVYSSEILGQTYLVLPYAIMSALVLLVIIYAGSAIKADHPHTYDCMHDAV
jgi:hypothetical protein